MKIIKNIIPLTIIIAIVSTTNIINISCSGNEMNNDKSNKLKNIKSEKLERLSSKKIFFGHQSIGFEIIDGIEIIQRINPDLKFKIIESNNPADFSKYNFLHSRVGMNCNPKSKIDAFTRYINNGIGNTADFAFFKLCFVDVDDNTDIADVFNYYKNSMEKLKIKYPKTKFIHFTMPLVSEKLPFLTGIKNIIKHFMNRYIVSSKLNNKRNQYNELLRNEYKNTGELFDLAMYESVKEENIHGQTPRTDGNEAMCYEYTYDGGHLNEKGRVMIAQQLLLYLINQI
ncbi:MAG: hypothetical protein MUC95_07150 [Spirochaetes bacterium]|jgi:hypothetical protein|nr:hypothetical protein [Spirochaetota bacterium]